MSRCPYGRHWATATLACWLSLGSRSRNSSSSRVFPTPAGAMMLTRKGRCSLKARRATSSIWSRSGPRPISGSRGAGAGRPARARTGSARIGRLFPRASTSIAAPNLKVDCASRAVRSPHTIIHGSAACCSRAATLTVSPVTRKSPLEVSRAATTSPVLTPTRIGNRVPSCASLRTWSRNSMAAERARCGSSPCAWGRPKTAITASPMNFSTVPPCSATTSFAIV